MTIEHNNIAPLRRVAAYTLGCKVNAYDTQAMLELFHAKGYEIVNFNEFAHIYIINTCTVTNPGDKKSRQMIRKAKAINPKALVVACGCYAQVSPETVKNIYGVNMVLGTKNRSKIVELVEEYSLEHGVYHGVSDIMDEALYENLSVTKHDDKTRGYIKIQEGCEQYCSYCIIPYARGRVRSRKPEDILQEAQTMSQNGYKEIVLAGIHVASYGKDLAGINLLKLLPQICAVKNIKRVRFSSIEPTIVTEEFIALLADQPKICRHFHLSLQSGCDDTLGRMNRKYTTKQYEDAVTLLKNAFADVAITTDIIVGFPGETQEHFKQSYAFVNKMKLAALHVFPYSPKEGTPSAKFPNQISPQVKAQRSKAMIALGAALSASFIKSLLNTDTNVLFEQEISSNYYEGYTSNYVKVRAYSSENIENHILKVHITEALQDLAIGSLLD